MVLHCLLMHGGDRSLSNGVVFLLPGDQLKTKATNCNRSAGNTLLGLIF